MSATATTYGPCSECGSENVSLHIEDAERGESGPFTLTCDDCPAEFYVPTEASSRVRIHALRAIVRDHQAARIDGYLVDAMTAGLLVQVYDALSPANREKFGKPSLLALVNLAWKHAK